MFRSLSIYLKDNQTKTFSDYLNKCLNCNRDYNDIPYVFVINANASKKRTKSFKSNTYYQTIICPLNIQTIWLM